MLAALMLAGLAAAAMVPFAFDHLFDDEDDPVEGETAQVGGTSAGGEDMISMSEYPDDAAPIGAQHEIAAMSGDAVLTAFDPGCDRCTLTIDTWDSEIVLADDADGVSLSFTNAAETVVTVRFPGLSELPVDAITVCVDSVGEDGPVTFPLSEVFADVARDDAGAGDGSEEGSVLSPADPDAPDDLPDPLHDALPLGPVDPDTPDLPPADLWEGDMLAPVVDDDAPEDGSLVWGDPETGAPKPVVIEGFDPGDLLSITLSPAAFPGPLEVTVMPAGTGDGTAVLVDGQAVAVVTGPTPPAVDQVHVSVAGKISR